MLTLTFKTTASSDVSTFLTAAHDNDAVLSTSTGANTVTVELEDIIAEPNIKYWATETKLVVVE